MSLTELLQHADVREKFNSEFAKPKVELHSDVYVPSSNPAHAQLVGTAFDYVLRFHIAATNDNVYTRPWIAERAVDRLEKAIARRRPVFPADRGKYVSNRRFVPITFKGQPMLALDRKLSKREQALPELARRILDDGKHAYRKCCDAREVSRRLVRSAWLLAQLDAFYRSGFLSDSFGTADDGDVRELCGLLEVVRDLPKNPFVGSRVCLLNPTFGEASTLVGGADADMFIDDTLIELKTEQELTFRAETFRQLLGYYILHAIGGFGTSIKRKLAIRHIAVYSSRFGAFVRIPVESVVNPKTLPALVRWFTQRALTGPMERTQTVVCDDGTKVTF